MTKMYLKSYKLEGILPGKVIEEGYPRNDFLLNTKRRGNWVTEILWYFCRR